MNFNGSGLLQGQQFAFHLGRQLGEGDAGEVFEVENVSQGGWYILKRPRKSAFPNEFRRQAEQIRQEGRLLAALPQILSPHPSVQVPQLIDQAKPGTEFSENYFIVIDRAQGFDLSNLARTGRIGLDPGQLESYPPAQQVFLSSILKRGEIPERILLEALHTLLAVFSTIHTAEVQLNGTRSQGVIWNDVKPDHVFWDPETGSVTLIDWGNARLLDANGTSPDRRYTVEDDLRQFCEEMGRFLQQANPALHAGLSWPQPVPGIPLRDDLETLHDRIRERLRAARERVKEVRAQERKLHEPALNPQDSVTSLATIHQKLVELGEIPDLSSALQMVAVSVANLAAAGDMAGVSALSHWATEFAESSDHNWGLIGLLATSALQAAEPARAHLISVVQAATQGEWVNALWSLIASLSSQPEPEDWNNLLAPLRKLAMGEEQDGLRPLLVLRRSILTLQSQAQAREELLARSLENQTADTLDLTRQWNDLLQAIERLRETALNWIQPDPLPPWSTVSYAEADSIVDDLRAFLPDSAAPFIESLQPAFEVAQEFLGAWERREISNARRLLRRLLPWDPDRRRLIPADSMLESVPEWMNRLRSGPRRESGFIAQISDLEYDGREIRSRIGPAGWLDRLLESLKAMRQGQWPGDILRSKPDLLNDLPWLAMYERSSTIHTLLNPQHLPLPLPAITGAREENFGPEGGIRFLEPADAWIPEARGSSARVYHCQYEANDLHEAVLKIMRMDKTGYSEPLFREEALILDRMAGLPGVNPLLESGFFWMGERSLPGDQDLTAIRALHGPALRLGPDQVETYLSELSNRIAEGWTPYLILRRQPREENLLLMCDASLNRGHLREVEELLRVSIQICEVLAEAHSRNIVYRDHKILHYYWNAARREMTTIDWNVARYHPDGPDPAEIAMDLVQFGARGLHHILTGRTAPGALPLGPTRPEEIEQSAHSYRAQWTYDDQRLNQEVRTILEQLLAGSYTSPLDLRDDLRRACLNLE